MAALFRRALFSEYLVLWLCAAYVAALAPFTPGFLLPDNLANLLATLLPLFLVALGQTIVLIAGGIDLSVTSTLALASIVGAKTVTGDDGWLAGSALAAPVAVLLMVAVGSGVGALNGTAVVHELAPGSSAGLTIVLAQGSVLIAAVAHPGVRVELPGGEVRRLESLATDVRVDADAFAA